jgi:hypothetical protein
MEEMPERSFLTASRWGLIVVVAVLCCAVGFGGFYLVREHKQAQDLAANNLKLATALSLVQSQLAAVSDKLSALNAPPAQTAASARPSAMPARTHAKTKRRMTVRRASDDPRWKQVQGDLAEQQKQLASTREDLAKTRSDLEGNLNSARDELNGSIAKTNDKVARTHEELVVLQKRGERNYYEFTLDKAKKFQRVGPISVSLRKVNFKRKHYNMVMMVDDFQLNKNNVNLYEPVWITLSDRPQPLEMVVNSIHKDQIQGYISEPKYKKSELAASAAPAPATKPQENGTPQ